MTAVQFTLDAKKNLCLLTDPSLFMDTLGSVGTEFVTQIGFFIREIILLLLSIFGTRSAGNVKEKQIMHISFR